MSPTKHAANEDLILFLENPADLGLKDLSLHLATCQSCRIQMSALSKLKETLQEIATESTLDTPNIAVSEEDLLAHPLLNPQNLKAALHFETHRAAMDRALFGDTEAEAQKQAKQSTKKKSGFSDLIQGWLRLRTPFWVTVPTAAFAAIFFIFILSPTFSPDTKQLTIARYQDNAVIEFRDKTAGPGMGFFDKARTNIQTFENINVTLIKDRGIALSWPSVKNAIDYKLTLQIIQEGKKRMVDEITTKETQTIFQNSTLEKNTRYEWVLSGQTQDNKFFRTSGGFIMTQTN